MSRAASKMRVFAERLIAHEANGNKSSGKNASAAFHIFEKLRPHLGSLMGYVGFGALLSRALTLVNDEVPWLRAVQVKADGSLAGLEEVLAQLAPEEIAEGRLVLLTQVLGLLETFIGESLTVRLVAELWPKLPRNDAKAGNGDQK